MKAVLIWYRFWPGSGCVGIASDRERADKMIARVLQADPKRSQEDGFEKVDVVIDEYTYAGQVWFVGLVRPGNDLDPLRQVEHYRKVSEALAEELGEYKKRDQQPAHDTPLMAASKFVLAHEQNKRLRAAMLEVRAALGDPDGSLTYDRVAKALSQFDDQTEAA